MALRYARRSETHEFSQPTFVTTSHAPIVAPAPCRAIVRLLPRAAIASDGDPVDQDDDLRLPSPGTIRGLIIDADLVLCSAAAWCRSLAQLLWHVGHGYDHSSSDRLWRNRHLTAALCGRRELADVLDDYLYSLGLPRGQRDEVLAAALRQWRETESQLHFLPGAREAVRRIVRAGVRMALVADDVASGAELAARVADSGLSDAFAAVVTSVDVDRVLPDMTCCRVASARLGLPASETLFVAEDRAILNQAVAAGLRSVLCGDSGGHAGDWRVRRLDQLAAWFEPASQLAKTR